MWFSIYQAFFADLMVKIQQNKRKVPYFFSYKTGLFSFQNNPKDLDPSYKMDLDLSDCFGRV